MGLVLTALKDRAPFFAECLTAFGVVAAVECEVAEPSRMLDVVRGAGESGPDGSLGSAHRKGRVAGYLPGELAYALIESFRSHDLKKEPCFQGGVRVDARSGEGQVAGHLRAERLNDVGHGVVRIGKAKPGRRYG